MLAGWLFADLFLVLFMIALSVQPSMSLTAHGSNQKHSKTQNQQPHRTTVPPKPAPPKPAPPPGLASTPTDFCVSQSGSLLTQFEDQVQAHGRQGRRAGFILVFATAPPEETNQAIALATAAIATIRNDDPDRADYAGLSGEGLWGGESNPCGTNNYHIQIFFYL